MERRLTGASTTDAIGSRCPMGEFEVGTPAPSKIYQTDLITPKVALHGAACSGLDLDQAQPIDVPAVGLM